MRSQRNLIAPKGAKIKIKCDFSETTQERQ